MSIVVAAYPAQTQPCQVDGCKTIHEGVSAYPVSELVIDGSQATVKACALCIAESWERVTGWRFVNLLLSMRMGSELGKLTRGTNKETRRARGRKGGDALHAAIAAQTPALGPGEVITVEPERVGNGQNPDERDPFPDDGRALTDGAITDEHTV